MQSALSHPVARVCVDVHLPHLDRPFDYLVPPELSSQAQPGVRVRVRFAGRLVQGFVLSRTQASTHSLQPIQRVFSDLPVLTPEIARLCREVADRYAGTMAEVVKAAVPPRHARAENAARARDGYPASADSPVWITTDDPWAAYTGGDGLLTRLAAPTNTRVVWSPRPGEDPAERITDMATAALPRGPVVIVAPNAREVNRIQSALKSRFDARRICLLTADQGPQARYSAFVHALTGRCDIVVGTRAAAFAPVDSPAALLCWEDVDESLVDPQRPGWHAREVMALRAGMNSATALVVGGFARSVETQGWVEAGWAVSLTPTRPVIRTWAPRVKADPPDSTAAASHARIRDRVFPVVRAAIAAGPVLVQVPRRGYVPNLVCQNCREPARCPTCTGPLTLASAQAPPHCAWCRSDPATVAAGTAVAVDTAYSCRNCGSQQLRATAVGVDRTAEELTRSFPGVPIVSSSGDHMVHQVDDTPALVIATPGSEPDAPGGYTAVVLLDAAAMARRPGLRSSEETLRRWMYAANKARPGSSVVIAASPTLGLVQAFLRWDSAWWAARDLAERGELHLPPTVRSATIEAGTDTLLGVVEQLQPSDHPNWRFIGPIPLEDQRSRLLLSAPRAQGPAFVSAIKEVAAAHSKSTKLQSLQVRVDPYHWGVDA